jgi:translocation and assembly module TamA
MPRLAHTVISLCAVATAAWATGHATRAETPKEQRVRYTVAIDGLEDDKKLADQIRDLSQLVEQRDKPPHSIFVLEDRARADRARLRKFLRSEGYYAGRVAFDLEETAKPVKVTLKVHRGPAYRLTEYRLKWQRPGAPSVPLDKLGLKLGQRARAEPVVKAQSALLLLLADKAFPFAKVVNRRVVVDHAARTMRVAVTVDRGRRVRFGRTEIKGAPGVDRGLVRRRLRWARNAPYRTKPLKDARKALFELGVFSSVRITPDPSRIGPDGETPMRVELAERKRHSVSITGYYDTSLGPGGEVEWLNRNLFGGAERLSIRLGGTFVEYGGKLLFRKPDLFEGPQDLIGEARYQELNAPAYDGREAVASVAIARRLSKRLTVKAGPIFDWSSFKVGPKRDYFTLFGAKATLDYDQRDDKLDPTRGYRLSADVATYVGSNLAFARAIGRANGYWSPWGGKRFTLAGWSRISAVFGENRANLPPNKRIYAGGGNSIRGFGYQRVGPLDSSNNPIGGKSAIEFGVEARLRFTKTWGGVLFVEGGNVFRDLSPDFNEPFRWGAGAGVRYKSPIGLLRLDLATPLNRRTGDSVIQIYISIGQAF